MTASFQILLNPSSFIYHSLIRSYVVVVTERASLNKLHATKKRITTNVSAVCAKIEICAVVDTDSGLESSVSYLCKIS
jgi:hypothetical protein